MMKSNPQSSDNKAAVGLPDELFKNADNKLLKWKIIYPTIALLSVICPGLKKRLPTNSN